MRGGADLAERGVIFEGLTGLGGAVVPVAPNDRASRQLMTRLVARQRLQREGGAVRRLRERETVAFRRALYRSGIRVRSVTGVGNQGQQQRDITADSFRRHPTHLNRLRPWLRRELTVLYGAHGSLVDIVQRIIMSRLARHGLEDTPTIEEELRPFLLARTDHFLHELVSFARSPLSLENYDLQAVYEPPATALELDGMSSSSDSSSVIAISEGEEEERRTGGRSEEGLLGRAGEVAYDDVIQTGSCLSLSAWDDETPGPSYSTAEPSCSLAPLSFSPAQEAANEDGGEKREEEWEEECLIVGYKKPIAERTPELVQLSSDTEEEVKEEKKKEEENTAEKLPPLPSTTPPLSYLPTIPPSTSGAYRDEQDSPKERDGKAGGRGSRARSWSDSSGRSKHSVCMLSLAMPGESERRERESWRDRKQSGSEAAREKRRRKRRKRGQESSSDRLRKSGTLYNPNRSIYPAMMRHRSRSHSPSPFRSSVESGSPLPPSPPDSSWEYHCSQVSPLTSSVSSPSCSSSSSPLCSSPQPSSQTPPTPSLSPSDRSNNHHGEKPGGKRKYKSRHLDSDDKDPTWMPSSSHHREKRRRRRERDGGGRRERQRSDAHRERGGDSSRRCREDRSPSVEIIYEGTITSNTTQPPARKRRRKRHRKTQHSSSPVIITLDSDSSQDDVNNRNNSSSSPLSSQQTVDFSELTPLPLVHSAGVGGALNAEIGELPVDILDRASDGSETEPAGQSEAAGPIAVDNSDNSDHDVDVENVEESGSLLGSDDDEGPMREANTKATTAANRREAGAVDGGSRPTGESDAAPTTTDVVCKRDSEVLTSDSRLLASILNDLKGITAPKRDLSSNFKPSCSPDTRKKRCRDHSNQDDWLAETRHPNPNFPERQQSNDIRDQNQGFPLPTFCSSIPPLPPLERLKECKVREEDRDVPPLLKQASPPPLKHKDAGSPHLSPISSTDLDSPQASVEADPVGVNSHVDLNSNPTIDSQLGAELPNDNQAIPPISTLKRHFTNALALRGELASTSSILATAVHSSCHLAPTDLHPVNSLSPTEFHSAKISWSKDKPAHSDSTSRGCRNKSLSSNSCPDLEPSSSVSAEDTLASSDVFSGANCNDTSPPVFVSSIDSRTQNPSLPFDSHSSKRENLSQRLSPSRVSSVPTMLSPTDLHPRSPKSTVDLLSSGAEVLRDNKTLPLVNHEERLPHGYLPSIDLHCTSPVPPANVHSSSFVSTMVDQHLNHTALSSSTFQTAHRKCSSQSKTTVESHSKLLHPTDSDSKPRNHFNPSSNPQFPIDTCSKHNLPNDSRREFQPSINSHPKKCLRDLQLPTDNHITSSPQSVENRWNSNSSIDAHSDSESPVDERSASSIWNTHTHSAT